jgi:uncharacterized protein (TIGR03067 family)
LFGALALAHASLGSAAEEGFTPIFNGKDLSGWQGNPDLWSVRDGAITGVTKADPKLTHNTFLVWTNGTLENFELRLTYRIVAGNSGIQYRSKVAEQGKFGPVVGGYQADFEAGKTYSGILYEERGRGILAERGQKTVIEADPADPNKPKIEVVGSVGKSDEIQARIRNEDWNDYVIIAQGNHLQHFINGVPTVDVVDEQSSKAAKSGVLALQIHVGPPMTVQFKNIRVKTLTASAATDLQRAQGHWVVAELVADGAVAPAGDVANLKLRITGNDFAVDAPEGPQQGTLKFDESTNPKSLEVTTLSGDEVAAIYELNDSTLRVCYAPNGGSRPKAFKSTDGSGVTLITFKRKP